MKGDRPTVRLGEALWPTRRPVSVEPGLTYREIGIRSHGRGIFHKTPVSGAEIGNKRVFYIEPGDFVLNIVFAWEGAVAVAGAFEAGMIGSHRFPTFRPDPAQLEVKYLLYALRTEFGRRLLEQVSLGGAGRNRTLSVREDKRRRLEAKGWKVGSAQEFLRLSAEEAAYIDLKVRLATSLRERRRRRRLTQAGLAKLLRSSQSRVAKMEAGNPSVSLDRLIRAHLVLGTSRLELSRIISTPSRAPAA